MTYYVCDNCGLLVSQDEPVPEDGEWTCDCGSHTAWEFTNRANAESHAAHIRRLNDSKLFRKVSRR